jgi:hypothetical protein
MNRTERKLITLAQKRARLMQRIAKAGEGHKATRDLQARLVDATAQQIRAEIAIERKQGRAA